jgi:hypothetical protein
MRHVLQTGLEVDPQTAYAEIARVLRPGGVFANIWNREDETVDGEVALADLVGVGKLSGKRSDFRPCFERPEQTEFRHSAVLDADKLLAYVRSRSRFLTADEDGQQQILESAEAIIERLPERFAMSYVAVTIKARRR